jgi:ATP-dependent RNA helicase DHX57
MNSREEFENFQFGFPKIVVLGHIKIPRYTTEVSSGRVIEPEELWVKTREGEGEGGRREEGGRRDEGGRRKEEVGRKEEGGKSKKKAVRRKEEGGRRKEEEEGGRRKEEEEGGRRKEEGGRRKEEGGRRREERGRRKEGALPQMTIQIKQLHLIHFLLVSLLVRLGQDPSHESEITSGPIWAHEVVSQYRKFLPAIIFNKNLVNLVTELEFCWEV